ncbi:MAG: hypothetical protein RI935_698 [Candidatus Parcubacteria bacterium]|jgi:hypothetical protein
MEKPHFEHSPPNDKDKELDTGPSKLSRRSLLFGALGMVTAGPVLRGVQRLHNNQNHKRAHEGRVEDPRSPLFIKALESIDKKVAEIEKDPTVSRSKRAKEALSKTSLPSDGEGIALYFSSNIESGVASDDALAIPSVTDMRRFLHDKKIREYHVTTKEADVTQRKVYGIRVSDMYKDIGVSSRLTVEEKTKDTKKKKTVLAVKRARYDQGKGGYGEYITYTPAHADLRTSEVITSGVEYVNTVIDEAVKLFVAKGIQQSILKPSTEVARRVAVIEHIDPYEFYNKNRDNKRELKNLYDISLAEYSLNLGIAYNHLINSAGAGGMMQIIPRTYRDVRARIVQRGWFKEQDLPEDVNEGRKSPLVSAVISIALSYLNYELKQKLLSGLGEEDRLLVLASMYNGSPKLLDQILKSDIVSKVLRPIKKQKDRGQNNGSNRSVREKLFKNGKGNILAGTEQTENENYMQKFIAYNSFVTQRVQ